MKTAAILCAQGLGDGLLMMIVAHQFQQAGFKSTVFHDEVSTLSPLFEGVLITSYPSLKALESTLASFDHIILENDNSKRAWHLFYLRDQQKLPQLTVFFPTPCKKQKAGDFLFNPNLPVASNLRDAVMQILSLKNASKENGISLPKGKKLRRFSKRIVIHPTSNDPKRNWRPDQFLALAALLKKEGYEISFTVSPVEYSKWKHVEALGYTLPRFSSLKDVAGYLYESGFLIGNDSGIGHLASNLKIPTLTISGNPKRVRLWRPDWHIGRVISIPFPLPNFKGINFRIRENFWQRFISVRRTLRAFHKLCKETS